VKLTLFIDNDNYIELVGLVDNDGNYKNAATVTVTLKDSDGSNVAGAVNLSMNYLGGTNGDYSAQLEDTLPLIPGDYTAEVSAAAGSMKAKWLVACEAKYRTS